MKNTFTICEMARQLVKTCEKIESLSCGLEQLEKGEDFDAFEQFENMRLDELEHAQYLMLKISEQVLEETPTATEEHTDEGDGGIFAEGELTYAKGELTEVKDGDVVFREEDPE